MARIRTIKPDFFRHAGLYDAEQATGLPLRVAFAGLWTAADREGRFEWKPRELKLDCLPFDEVDFSRVLDALATRGFIEKYACDGREFGFIPSWRLHQVINNRETASNIPKPNENNKIPTREPRVNDACVTRLCNYQGEGEGKGKGIKPEETTPASDSKNQPDPGQPPAGAVPPDGGKATPKPGHIAAGLSLDALRVSPGVGTDQHEAAGELWAVLAANGCRGTASHPSVIEMARDGVTVAELRAAIAEARKSNDGPLNPAYLAPIIERLRSGKGKANGKAAAWATDERATEAKARELGLWPARGGESWDDLRGRIRAKLSRQAEESVR